MSTLIENVAPPLHQDSSGALRVGRSRVLLELVIRAFEDGATAEAIVQRYPTTRLADIYIVIGYYLNHRTDIDAYLVERERRAEEVGRRIDVAQGDLAELRRRILSRREG
jgi:uncharacterized protein (DUF433 family)